MPQRREPLLQAEDLRALLEALVAPAELRLRPAVLPAALEGSGAVAAVGAVALVVAATAALPDLVTATPVRPALVVAVGVDAQARALLAPRRAEEHQGQEHRPGAQVGDEREAAEAARHQAAAQVRAPAALHRQHHHGDHRHGRGQRGRQEERVVAGEEHHRQHRRRGEARAVVVEPPAEAADPEEHRHAEPPGQRQGRLGRPEAEGPERERLVAEEGVARHPGVEEGLAHRPVEPGPLEQEADAPVGVDALDPEKRDQQRGDQQEPRAAREPARAEAALEPRGGMQVVEPGPVEPGQRQQHAQPEHQLGKRRAQRAEVSEAHPQHREEEDAESGGERDAGTEGWPAEQPAAQGAAAAHEHHEDQRGQEPRPDHVAAVHPHGALLRPHGF